MTENTNLKKYDIEIEETLRRVVRVEAENIYDAIDIVEDKINTEEIVLTADDYTGERTITNYNSKKLDQGIEFLISYNSKYGLLKMQVEDKKSAEYVCDNVKDLKNYFNIYIENYIEESEIEASLEDNNLEYEIDK